MILSGKNEIPIGTVIKLFHVSYLGFYNQMIPKPKIFNTYIWAILILQIEFCKDD